MILVRRRAGRDDFQGDGPDPHCVVAVRIGSIHAASLFRARSRLGPHLPALHSRPIVRAADRVVRADAARFLGEFAVAIGYSGLAMMGLQFGLTARFRYVTEPWGEDVVYHFHRRISLVAIALVILHVVILFALRPQRLAMLNVLEASWRATFGALSIYALIALVITALWRTKLTISYETWHLAHIVLAIVAIGAGAPAHGGLWPLFGRPLEAGAVGRAHDLLDRASHL